MTITLHKNSLLVILFSLLCFGCRTHKSNLAIEKINVNFSGGNNYPKISNQGGIEFYPIVSDTNISILKKFDVYSPLKEPVLIKLSRNKNTIVLSDQKGNEFDLAFLDSTGQTCNYGCYAYFNREDKIHFTSRLAFFPYWHGIEALGGHPFFMRHHYYTLIIKKKDGKKLKMQWTYSMQKYKPYNSKRRKWSGDYCVDNGGGLTLLKINN